LAKKIIWDKNKNNLYLYALWLQLIILSVYAFIHPFEVRKDYWILDLLNKDKDRNG
jgi:hypothetical protein